MAEPLYVNVVPSDRSPKTFGGDEDHVNPQPALCEQLEKANTLSYQMPDAATEIRRLDDLKRTLDKDLLRMNPPERAQHAVLSEWLSSNDELSLVDAGLAESEMRLKDMCSSDSAGLGRYAMRGDLRTWMDRVAQLDAAAAQVAGEWSPEDVRRIEDELRTSVRQQVARDAERKRQSNIEYVQILCGHLAFISEGRDFTIDSEFVTDDTDQLRRLTESVADWRSSIERFGHPGKMSEKEIQRRVDEIDSRRREERDGILQRAASQGTLLTDAQVDQVLEAMYNERCPPSFLPKTVKAAMEETMADVKRSAEALVTRAQRRVAMAEERCAALQQTVSRLEIQLAESQCDPQKRQDFVEGLEQSNAQMQVAAEMLARKRVQQCENEVLQLQDQLQSLRSSHDRAVATVKELQSTNESLRSRVDHVSAAWEGMLGLKQSHEAELAKIHGGQVNQLQRVAAALAGLMNATIEVLNAIIDTVENFGDREALVERMRQAVGSWRHAIKGQSGLSDGSRSAADAVYSRTCELNSHVPGKAAESSNHSSSEANRAFVDGLLHRIDVACGELQSKHREQRFMKKVVAYFVRLVSSMIDNTYDQLVSSFAESGTDAKKLLPFPPPPAVAPDEAYALVWGDEVKALERLAIQLRPELSDTIDRSGTTNALLSAVEVVADASARARSPPKSPPSQGRQQEYPDRTFDMATATVVSEPVQVKRDARLILHDARHREARLGGASVLAELRREKRTVPVNQSNATNTVELFRSARRDSVTPTPASDKTLPPVARSNAKIHGSKRGTKL
uniref:Uncharacterized protein n=1 Tax=Neobodo designis TaxID=312471 RepID=A0A7S1QAD3_NEODS|mmetsp:Transcript_3663/g.11531  ORF Transcript_3663/g.11531 Transcript_3663/m.11531 type:complete len:793 (+) Transcript_3663:25-2403(+)